VIKTLFKLIGWLLLALILIAGAVIAWANWHLSKDRTEGRPTFSKYEMGDGAADGSAKPDATGYVLDSTGRGRILPPMPPEKPMDIHTAANYKSDYKIRSCFWPGPRARSGVFTNDGNSFSFENQFPDNATTYIPTAFRLAEGARIVIKGQFPHMRYWNFNTYNAGGVPQDALNDVEIDPDAGSQNPFRPGVSRDVAERNYTFRIVNGMPPAQREKNTLYTMAKAGEEVFLWMRNYVPDGSKDYLGSVALPTVELHTADGKVVSGEEACEATKTEMRGKQLPSTVKPALWAIGSHLPWVDTANLGAKDVPAQPLQVFFNRKQVLSDLLAPSMTPAVPQQTGGWWSNLATRYGYGYISRNYGKVYVLTGKMPTTPQTWHGGNDNGAEADMRYKSVCTGGALSSSITPDCIYDEQMASTVDAETGRFAVVISRSNERPKNATEACGVAWIDSGNGDGMPSGSANYTFVIDRETMVNPKFKHSWFDVKKTGGEKEARGDYLSYLLNLKTTENFEALGCPVDKKKLWAMLPR